MKLITKDTDYAVKALSFMAEQKEKIISVSEVAKALRIPRAFLRKLLQILNRKGILKSYKGNSGGFSVAIPAEEIFLVDLIEIFQGPFKLNECLFKKRICPDVRACLLKQKLAEIEKYVVSQLESISIGSLRR